jgi:lysophospholipase L1-like esterase
LQSELGDGGPGFVYVVQPHRFCQHEAITRSSSGPWATYAISTVQTPDGLYGPGGSTTQATEGASATIKLVAGTVTHIELYTLGQPHGGSAVVRANGTEVAHSDTAAEAKEGGFASGTVADGANKLEIETHGRVRLFGIDLENTKGAVVDNLGIVSVNVKSMANNDAAHWTAELGHRGADLLMIMIGANEAEWLSPGDKDTKDYQAHYEQILAPLRKGRPDASCLVVSPTDQAEEHDGGYRSRPVMPLLVAAQRKAAEAQGCAFYSTYDWMGGKGSAAQWFKKRLVSSDFQHLSKAGANKMADAVFDALMAGYQRYARK